MISVIIPVYDGAQYVDGLCEALRAQALQDFEVIFINDGSRDQTLDRISSWQRDASLCIKIIDQENGGVSAARNAGIDAASGSHLCFVDVDDLPRPNYLSDLFAAFTGEVDAVFCKQQLSRIGIAEAVPPGETGSIRRVDRLECLRDFLYGRLISGCCTMMIRTEVVIKAELRFAESYKFSEDLHFVWRAIASCRSIAYVDSTLYVYMLQSESATSRFTEERLHGFQLMKSLEEHFDRAAPAFASEFRRYGAARIAWSIAWQSAVRLSHRDYLEFVHTHPLRSELAKLLRFPDVSVAASSFVFVLNARLFRRLVQLRVSPATARTPHSRSLL